MTPFIIPFFLLHQGCPHRCLYCNQHRSGGRRAETLTAASVAQGLEAGLSSPRRRSGVRVEAAFYGGTFTALPRDRQAELLEAVIPFLKHDLIQGIRLSTRPDALPVNEIEFLKSKGVTIIEIGAQSMDDQVLKLSRRGHTASDTRKAARRVKAAGLGLGLQLLPGLPGEDTVSLESTVHEVIDLFPDESRLYPALVIKGTPLADLYLNGAYQPLTLNQTVEICAMMYKRLTRAGIIVTRIGLQTSSDLEQAVLAGPYHPALGDLVKAEVFYQAIVRALRAKPPLNGEASVTVSWRDLSQARGHARSNLARLSAEFRHLTPSIIPDPDQPRGQFQWQGETYSIFK
ncbi:MAG: radical SAM protein [Deltaproteobacteria bacterium]|nr:radical SAM protein [Deltaproteobacteria bacterium]